MKALTYFLNSTQKQNDFYARGLLVLIFLLCLIGSGLAQLTSWNGNLDTDWNNSGNWTAGVPTATSNVIIEVGTFNPSINATGAVALSMRVEASTILTVAANVTLNVFGDVFIALVNVGTINNNGIISVGDISNTVNFGMDNQGTFNNSPGATIKFFNQSFLTLHNISTGTFNNSGTLSIGATGGLVTTALRNDGTLNNNVGGIITIDNASNSAVTSSGGTFNNDAVLLIGSTSTSVAVGMNIEAGAIVTNSACAIIHLVSDCSVRNSMGTITNAGIFIYNGDTPFAINSNTGLVYSLGVSSAIVQVGNPSISTFTIQWTGCTNTDWHNESNWNTGMVPASAADFTIPNVTNAPSNSGSITIGGTLTLLSGSTLTNTGTLVNSSTLTNNGTLNNDNGGSLTNTGTLTNVGTLNNDNGSSLTNTGTVTNNGTLSFTPSCTLSNSGTVLLNTGGTLNVNTSSENLLAGTFTWNGGIFEIGSSASMTTSTSITIPTAGTLSLKGKLNILDAATLTNNGSLIGAATAVAFLSIRNGGSLINNSTFTTPGGFSLIGTLTNSAAGVITNLANLTISPPNLAFSAPGGVLINHGTFNNNNGITNENILSNRTGATLNNNNIILNLSNTGVFTNTGTFNNNSGFDNLNEFHNNAGGLTTNTGDFDNFLGSIIQNNGVFENTNTLLNIGILNLNTGGNLILNTSSASWPSGTFNWTGGTLTVGANGSLTLATNRDIATGQLLAIEGNLIVPSGKTLTTSVGGDVYIKPGGVLTNQLGGTLSNNGVLTNNGTLTNTTGATLDLNSGSNFILANSLAALPGGTFNWNAGSTVSIAAGADLTAPTAMTIPTDATLQVIGSLNINGALTNNGNLIDRGTINNNGTLDLNTGSNLLLTKVPSVLPTGAFNWKPGSTVTITDTAEIVVASSFSIPTGAILNIKGDLINNGTLTNNGTFDLASGGLLELNSTPTTFPGGTFNWNAGGNVTIGAAADVTVATPLTIPSGALFTVKGSLTNNDKITINGIFLNTGTTINTDSLINNNTLSSTGNISLESGSYYRISNGFDVWSPTLFDWKLGASVEVAQGTTLEAFGNVTTEQGRTFIVNGGVETFGLDYTNNGMLKGNGFVEATSSFGAAAKIEPGNSIGTLSIYASADLGSATYTAEIDPVASTSDLLNVSGVATLSNATLEVDWLTTPISGATYTVMNFNSRVGEFATVTIPAVAGWTFTTNYTATTVTITTTAAPLPVELLSFSGKTQGTTNTLAWATASELNNDGFHIERSSANQDWEAIGFVKGEGASSLTNHYTFLDDRPTAGVNYYRLRQVDFDGMDDFSEVIAIEQAQSDFENLTAYPVPTESEVFVDFELNTPGQVQLSLTDLSGRILSLDTYKAIPGTNQVKLDLSSFAPGIYFVQLESKNVKLYQRIVKQ